MKNNKKGVSPLIATVLLIAFAVALGAIVMNWGRSYVEDTQDFARESSEGQLRCSSQVDLEFDIQKVEINDSEPTVQLSVLSKGNTEIKSFIGQFFDEDEENSFTLELDEDLPAFNQEKITFNITTNETDKLSLNELFQIVLIPRIDLEDGEDLPCYNKAVTVKNDTFKDGFIYNS